MIRAVSGTKRLVAIALAAAAGIALASQVPSRPLEWEATTLYGLQAQDSRVNEVAWRLTTGAVALCQVRQSMIGVALHTLDAYRGRYRTAAQRLWRLDQGAGVLAVATGSPAEAAGLRADDIIIAIDGSPLVRPRSEEIGSVVVFTQLTAALADGNVSIQTQRGDVRITARSACASRFEVTTDDDLVAQADGMVIQISASLVAQADTDEALAAVLAHELAHNVLRHRARLETARGGRRDRLFWSREAEIEADRFALRLLDRANFSIDVAIGFWTSYARKLARDNTGRGTHPDWQSRLSAMYDEACLIRSSVPARPSTDCGQYHHAKPVRLDQPPPLVVSSAY